MVKKNPTKGVVIKNSDGISIKNGRIEGYDIGIESTNVENLQLEDITIISKLKQKWNLFSSVQKVLITVIGTIIGGISLYFILPH